MKFKLLADCQEHIPNLAKLWYEEISRHWVSDATVEKAEQKLSFHVNNSKMPMAFVALHEDQPIGMACLREADGLKTHDTPWLGSLVVNPSYRKCRVGEGLINIVKQEAKKLGHQALYLLAFDPTIPNWYARLGWLDIGNDELLGHRVTVMKIGL
jgi:predicted N-acetyltransferase YhbS